MLWQLGGLGSFGESFHGFSEEARTRGFPSPAFGGFGFVEINYSKLNVAQIGQFSIGRNRYNGRQLT